MGLTVRRKHGEAVVLFTTEGPVTVSLSRIGEGSANITFEAPKSIRILRSEVVGRKAEAEAEEETRLAMEAHGQ